MSSLLSSAELLNVFLNLSHTHDIGTELLCIHASESHLFITKGWSFRLSLLQTLPFLRYQSNVRIPEHKLSLYLSFKCVMIVMHFLAACSNCLFLLSSLVLLLSWQHTGTLKLKKQSKNSFQRCTIESNTSAWLGDTQWHGRAARHGSEVDFFCFTSILTTIGLWIYEILKSIANKLSWINNILTTTTITTNLVVFVMNARSVC
jgi:hypothetical protein